MRLTSIRSLLAACACAAFASCGEPPQAATPMSGFLGVDLPFPGERPSGELADPEPAAEAAPEEAAPEEPQIVHDKSPEISILCYHEFIEGESHIAERINIQKFRTQMQAIKDARLSVISMDDFLAWRREEKNIPSPAILITIDDGWESTYTKAFPILKEYGFPFTLFLYKNYVNIGGKSLDSEQIEAMRKAGATVESHSVSHPLPSKIRNRGSRTPEEFDAFLLSELADSKAFLQQNFGVPIRAFAFPGGVYSDRLIELNDENKIYQAMFTCNPAKVNWETPSGKINRYIIHGNNDQNFGLATNFRGGVGTGMGKVLTSEPGEDGAAEPLYKVSPEDGASIADRLPEITVDLSKLEGVIPASIEMQISGFGQVIPTFDPGTGIVSYQVRERLRLPEYQVVLQLRRTGEEKADAIAWRFTVDQSSFYLPADYRGGDGDEEAGGAEAVPPAVGAGSAGDAIPN